MLTRPVDYERALAGSHRQYSRVDVHTGTGALLLEDLPFAGGNIRATLTSRVARRLSLQVDEQWYPVEVTDLLGPFGNELRAYRGVEYGDGFRVLFPAFRGRINSVNLTNGGQVAVSAVDRAGDIVDADFEAPHVSVAGLVTDEFRRLVVEVFPDAEFSFPDALGERTPVLVWESDRGRACDDLANTAGAFWYPLADGTFTMRRVPWAQEYAPLFTLADGEGGTVQASQVGRTRDNVFNSVTVIAERTDGSAPVRFTARDTDPTSPTYYLGPYGVKARQVPVQTAAGVGQARIAAETLLRRARALTETWSLEIVPDGSIELGDTVTVACRGRTATQVVAGFTMPLTTQGSMTVELRAQTPDGELS